MASCFDAVGPIMKSLSNLFTLTLLLVTSLLIKTSSADKYVGQVRLYVDKAGMDNWYKVTGHSQTWQFWREMNSTFFEMNDIYKSLERYGVQIQLQIADIVFLNRNILRTNGGKIINKQSLTQFENWLSPSYSGNKYDMSILYTGYNLVKSFSADGSEGYAYVDAVCSAKALGVVELQGTYMDVLITAHEIGHILGASHDGFGSGGSRCPSKSGYLMNQVTSITSSNHFYFSSCTASSMKATLNRINREKNNCMNRWYLSKNIGGPRYASLMTPDEICKRKFGQSSYIARKKYDSYGDSVCTHISCMTKTVGRRFFWSSVVTPQGLKCGKMKQCIRGKCTRTGGGSSSVSDNCPFGDQPKIEGSFQMTCSDVSSSQCSNWKNTCCQSCGASKTADEVCRDFEGKNSAMARRAYSSYGNNLCAKLACLTSVRGTRFYWNYHTAPDGMKCGKNKRCKGGQCVFSKQGDPKISDSCPFGDQPWLGGSWQTTCDAQIRKIGCYGRGWKETCCGSCNDPGTADQVCQNLVNKDSAMARRAYSSYGNNLCSKLACLTSVKGTYFRWMEYTAPNGMKCGKNKRCSNGKCLWTSAGDPNMSDSCPFGDQPWLAGSWQTTCKSQVKRNGCSGNGWKSTCCASC